MDAMVPSEHRGDVQLCTVCIGSNHAGCTFPTAHAKRLIRKLAQSDFARKFALVGHVMDKMYSSEKTVELLVCRNNNSVN